MARTRAAARAQAARNQMRINRFRIFRSRVRRRQPNEPAYWGRVKIGPMEYRLTGWDTNGPKGRFIGGRVDLIH